MKLISYLPELLLSPEIQRIQEAIEPEILEAWAARNGLMEQLNVSTATWGLTAWERALGLDTDVSRPAEYRRTRINSKLRGQGTTTVAMIKNVAESFSNGAVEVVEEPERYHIDIRFVGTIGVPPNMEDLTAAIEEIKPAHLAYDYVILYRTWERVGAYTWDALAGCTWDEVFGGEIA